MDGDSTAGQLTTALFGAAGLYFLARAVWGFSWPDRVSSLTHVVMSAVMVLMLWPVPSALPGILQIPLFAAAALWYVYLLASHRGTGRTPLLGHHSGSAAVLGYHAFMMASMVWMVFAASASSPPASGAVRAATARGMAAMGGMTGMSGEGAAESSLSSGTAAAVSSVVGAVFVAAAICFVALLAWPGRSSMPRGGGRNASRRQAGRRWASGRWAAGQVTAARLDAAGGAVMAAGMALTFLLVMS